jgi:hypothetical protein
MTAPDKVAGFIDILIAAPTFIGAACDCGARQEMQAF